MSRKKDDPPGEYKVYYGMIKANDICNCLSVPEEYINKKNQRNNFYSLLEESILKEGFRNPILVVAGFVPKIYKRRLPEFMQEDKNNILACIKLGGSRLWVAQKNNLEVPCIISDYCGRFKNSKELEKIKTEKQIIEKFTDKPRWVTFGPFGIATSQLTHYHLVRK